MFVKEQVDSLRKHGIHVTTFDVRGYESPFNYFKAVIRLFSLTRREKFDLIHAHYGLCVLTAYAQLRLPVIACFHGNDVLPDPSESWPRAILSRMIIDLNRFFARRARAVIVQSEEMKKVLGLPAARVIPFGVDLNLFSPMDRTEACLKLGLDVRRKRILFANDPTIPLKQFCLAQEVHALVRKVWHDTELVVIGNEPRDRVPLFMSASDVLVLTSLVEGSPNVVKEAMACNLPIVSVDVGDVRSVIEGTENCFITSRSAGDIARRIVQIFDSGKRSNGRQMIQDLGSDVIARRIIELYVSHKK